MLRGVEKGMGRDGRREAEWGWRKEGMPGRNRWTGRGERGKREGERNCKGEKEEGRDDEGERLKMKEE